MIIDIFEILLIHCNFKSTWQHVSACSYAHTLSRPFWMNDEEKNKTKQEARIITGRGEDYKHVTAVRRLTCLLHLLSSAAAAAAAVRKSLFHLCSNTRRSKRRSRRRRKRRRMDATDGGAQSEPLLPAVRAAVSGDKYLLKGDEYFRTAFYPGCQVKSRIERPDEAQMCHKDASMFL